MTIAIVAVIAVITAVWGIALSSKDRPEWGLASGLWVGLYCAQITLKLISLSLAARGAAENAIKATETPDARDHPGSQAGETKGRGQGTSSEPRSTEQWLTFEEFLFFLLLAPALACEVHLMKASARSPRRPLRALAEFSHGVLAFLSAHAFISCTMAPAMRILVAGLLPGSFVDNAGWTALEVAGHGGWPSWTAFSPVLFDTVNKGAGGSGSGLWVTLSCFLWLLVVCTTVLHFLLFYAFWHCTCLGIAELWGFPDRHLYGEIVN